MTQINNFDGGLSLRLDSTLIKLNEAVVLKNVNPNSALLVSAHDTLVNDSVVVSRSFYNFKDEWLSSSIYRDYIEYEDKLYYTQENGAPKVYDGTNYKNIGIKKPETTLAFNNKNEPILDQQGEQFNGLVSQVIDFNDTYLKVTLAGQQYTTSSLPPATYKYRITLVSDNTNVYKLDKEITITNQHTAVRLDLAKNNGLAVRIYREYKNKYYKLADVILDVPRAITDLVLDISKNDEYTEIVDIEGVVQYTMTYYNANDDIESAPLDYSNEITVKSGNIVKISNIPISDDSQVTHNKIYRLGGNLIGMTLVAELSLDEKSFYDYTSDINATEVLTTVNHYPPDTNLQYLTEAYGIFFGIVNNELKFSEIDEPTVWPPENSIKLRQIGTGLLQIPQGLLVFTKTLTYLLVGTNKANFSLILLSKQQGCLNHKSCQVVKNFPLWLSYSGICTIKNNYIEVVSKPLLGKDYFRDITVVQSVVYDEQYFMLKSDGNLIILDLRSGFRFYELDYINRVRGLAVYNGNLYFSRKLLLTLYKDDLSVGNLTLTYKSPKFIENNHAEAKMYNHVYIRANGDFTVTMYIDDEVALSTQIKGNKTFDLTPPTDKQRGYNCQFEIIGTGIVYSINTQPLGVQYGN